ncbi:MAG: hypothetical protein JWP44_2400 [Mucilaginibacter sp.]|nr:hypothetical protein [Mucilaginibacter sp.]
MLHLISDLPPHIAGIHAFADVSEEEYIAVLIPIIDDLLKRRGKINLVLVLETDIANFVSGAWCGNVKMGFRYFFKWKRVAIVTDQKRVQGYNDLFKYLVPGKYKKFPLDHLDRAIRWVSGKNGFQIQSDF